MGFLVLFQSYPMSGIALLGKKDNPPITQIKLKADRGAKKYILRESVKFSIKIGGQVGGLL